MRPALAWPLAAGLVALAVFVPVGHKEVTDESCGGNWREGRSCSYERWQAGYRLLSIKTHVNTWTESSADDPFGPRERVDEPAATRAEGYGRKAPHPDGITPFFWGGAAALAFAPCTAAAGIWNALRPGPAARWSHLTAWSLLTASLASFLMGVMLHSGTWEAEDVAWWRPGGGLACLACLASGLPLLPARERFQMPPLPVGA